MEFTIEYNSKNSGRLGLLKLPSRQKELKTPFIIQSTKSGSIPHISREVYDFISSDVPVLQASLCTIEHMLDAISSFPSGLFSAYFGYPESPLLLTLRDPCECTPSGFNEKDTVPLFTRRGKVPFSVEKYIKMVETIKPEIYQGFSDADTDADSPNKRIIKSVTRTNYFMQHCYKQQRNSKQLQHSALFAPIVGGYCSYAREVSLRNAQTNAENCQGYILEGFHKNGAQAMSVDVNKLLPIVDQCLSSLDANKPKYMPGAYLPLVQLQLVQCGVDIFDTSLAYCMARKFKVLCFDFDLSEPKSKQPALYLDITQSAYKEEFKPFRADCSCMACKETTRAYVNHLYNTKELLGPILIMIHNLHHLIEFYKKIRVSIANDTLPKLIELVREAGTHALPTEPTNLNCKSIQNIVPNNETIKTTTTNGVHQ